MVKCHAQLYAVILFVCALIPSAVSCREAAPPLLLSFNFSHDSDAEDFVSLDTSVAATYFVTGTFARKFPGQIATLSQSGTIGLYSTPDLVKLPIDEAKDILKGAMQEIASTTGKLPVWFRGPSFVEHEDVLVAARDLGFLYDSSEPERWVHQQVLEEFPISTNDTGRVIFSDYDMFSTYGLNDSMVLEILKENYMSRYQTGRPLVLLLNPGIIVKHVEVLNQFIAFVKGQGGRCLSFDQYLKVITDDLANKTIAVRIDLHFAVLDVDRTIAHLLKAQVSDVFIVVPEEMAQMSIAENMRSTGSVEANFNQLVQGLARAGIRVHASLSTLIKSTTEGEFQPQDKVGGLEEKSVSWVSPSHPDIIENLQNLVAILLDNYPIEGINLDGLVYPTLDYDYSEVALSKFAKDYGIVVDKGNAATLLQGKYYNEWVKWRTFQLRSLVEAVASTISNAGRGVLLSATLSGNSLTKYKSMEISGQDYRLLAEILDMIVTVPPESGGTDFSRLISMGRFKMGNKLFLLTIPPRTKTSHSKSEIDQFTEQLASARQGADGLLLSSYRLFFDYEHIESDRRDNLTHLLSVYRHPQNHIVNSSDISSPPPLIKQQTENIILNNTDIPEKGDRTGLLYIFVFVGLSIIVLIGIRLARRNIGDISLVEQEQNVIHDWQKFAKSIRTNQFSGRLVSDVAEQLAVYDQSSIMNHRMAFFLTLVNEAPETRPVGLVDIADDIPGWRKLVNSNLKKALADGFLKVDDNRVEVTEKGFIELNSMKEIGFDVEHWKFVELRLHETLEITCPQCGDENISYWDRQQITCTNCSQLIHLPDCKQISIRKIQ